MSDALDIEIRPFDELTRRQLHEILRLRCEVFVVGQEITAEPEVDGRDPECAHALVWDEGELVGTLRVFVDEEPMVVGRVAVDRDRQRQGIGTAMMEALQEWLGGRRAELHAQSYLEEWYARLGWERFGEEFIEAEIPHVHMRWPASG